MSNRLVALIQLRGSTIKVSILYCLVVNTGMLQLGRDYLKRSWGEAATATQPGCTNTNTWLHYKSITFILSGS